MSAVFDICFYKLKSIFDKKLCFSANVFGSVIDKTAAIRQNCRVYNSQLGRYSYVARNTLIQNTEIGNFCSISEGCNIGMPTHPTDMVSTSPVFLKGSNYLNKNFAEFEYNDCKKTTIGNDVWIGAYSQIKSGLTIGNGAVIGAGAVVTHDVPPYAIVGGVPAKIIRYRFDENTIRELLNSEWWNMSDEQLSQNKEMFLNIEDFFI